MRGKKNIASHFQYQWMLLFTAITVLGSALLIFTLQRFFDLELSEDFGQAFTTLRSLEDLLLPIIGFSVLFYAAMVCILAAAIVLYLSRLVSGPLFRLEEVAGRIRERNLALPAEHRPGEQLQELVAVVESLRTQYGNQLLALNRRIDAVEEVWRLIDAAPPDRYVETAVSGLRRIKEELERASGRLPS